MSLYQSSLTPLILPIVNMTEPFRPKAISRYRTTLGQKHLLLNPPSYASRSLQNKRFAATDCKTFLSHTRGYALAINRVLSFLATYGKQAGVTADGSCIHRYGSFRREALQVMRPACFGTGAR